MSDDERRHAEEVAREWLGRPGAVNDRSIAALIQRERAGLLARAEAAEARHASAEREVATWRHENADLRAKLAAAEAALADANIELVARKMNAQSMSHGIANIERRFEEERTRAEQAEAAAGQMRVAGKALLESLGEYVRQSMHGNLEWRSGIVALEAALATDAGRGYLSPKQVARERAEARDAALEEAAKACDDLHNSQRTFCFSAETGDFASAVRALKSRT